MTGSEPDATPSRRGALITEVQRPDEWLDRYLADLSDLVSIDSPTEHATGVNRVNDRLHTSFEALGMTVTRHQRDGRGDDMVARLHGAGRAKILLLGHSDTVYPIGTAAERPMSIDNGRVLGPGACDMKGGLLSGIRALDVLGTLGWREYDTISFLTVSDEEGSPRHSLGTLAEEGAAHDVVLTLEAARENGDIVSARKAVCWVTVEAVGRSAHAGVEPERGANAIAALADLVVKAQRLHEAARGRTLNAGTIRGGVLPNVVPDAASARFDLRAWTDVELERMVQSLEALARAPCVAGVAMRACREAGSYCPAMARTDSVARLESVATAIATGLGFELRAAATGGASDISYAMGTGIPGLDGLGPVGGLDHSPGEYIEIDSIMPRVLLLANLIRHIGEGEHPT
jgi:glutamate carboxypeptidase